MEEYIIKPEGDRYQKLVLGTCYDDIETYEDITIFTNNKQQFFIDKKNKYKSDLFDDIKIDEGNNLLIYCTKDNETKIFLRSRGCFIAKLPQCSLRFLSIWEGIYYFACYNNLNQEKLIGINGKTGLVNNLSDNNYFRIRSIFNPKKKIFLLDKRNGLSDVKSLDDDYLLKDIDFASYSKNNKTLVFKDGILSEDSEGSLNLSRGFDSVRTLKDKLYIISKGKSMGLWYAPYGEVIAPQDDNELVFLPNSFEIFKEDNIFICGLVNKKQFNLVKVIDNKIIYKTINSYDEGEFLIGNLIVLKNKTDNSCKTYIFNKYGIKILEFNKDIRAEYIYPEGYRDYEVYKIDGDYYKYNGKKIYKINLKEEDMFIGGIKTELGDIAINEYDEQKFNKWLKYFENKDNLVDIGDALLKLYNNKVEKKYPNLVRRIK